MMTDRKIVKIAVLASMLLASPMSMAAVSDEDFRALQAQVSELTQALTDVRDELAAERAKTSAAPVAPAAVAAGPAPAPVKSPSSWAEKVTVTGDIRARYENIDQENRDQERNRDRLRARAAIVAKPQTDLEVGFGLSTAQDADPVSSNQTIGNGGSRKDIYLDLAYFNWTAAEGLNLVGGKFKNNLYRPGKHGLIWDSDLNPEGAGVNWVNGPFFANLMGTWVESDSNQEEAYGAGGQFGVALPLGESTKLTAGVGYFDINTAGKTAFYVVPGSDPRFFGNTVDENDRYVYDYQEIEGFAELSFRMLGQPASVFVDYVQNADADEFDTGWAAGATLGGIKAKGTWEASYTYQDLERDAVLGLWTDSDFGGGGTDTSGHVLRGAYALSDKTNVAFSYFMNEFGDNAAAEFDYDRLQLDLNFKY